MTTDVRTVALAILNDLEKEHPVTLDQLLDTHRSIDYSWHHRNKAFLQALVFGILQSRNRLDFTIRYFSKTPFKKIVPEVKNILRLGVYQILYMDRVPDSAAVNTAVELTKKIAAPWTVKFVNGLLRNVARHPDSVKLPDIDKDPIFALCVLKSLPRWLVQRWLSRFGQKGCRQLCSAMNTIPPLCLRTNTLQVSRAKLLPALASVADTVIPTPHAPEGITLSGLQTELTHIPGFSAGHFQIQDEAAQLIARILKPRPGQRILDACAGLGGKTGHISQLIENTGEIIALEAVSQKLTALQRQMERLRITTVKPACHDLSIPPTPTQYGLFDRILLDAPCSGLGVLRRNPDIRWKRTEEDLIRYADRQRLFLDHLAPLVKPDGLLVYGVCSMEPEENEQVVHSFLRKNREFEQTALAVDTFNEASALIGNDGFLRTFPHQHNMDGFFAACFRRRKKERLIKVASRSGD